MLLINVEKMPKLEISFKSILFGIKIGTSYRVNDRFTNTIFCVFLFFKNHAFIYCVLEMYFI